MHASPKVTATSAGQVFGVFLKLGCTSFGGPVAHIGYFRNEFVSARKWIDDQAFADLVALCQFLPGPMSSQVGMAIGWKQAGWRGALAAWLGFTLPSAALMVAFAYELKGVGDVSHKGWIYGLEIAAVAVVAQAVLLMAGKLCPDAPRRAIAILALLLLSLFHGSWGQLSVVVFGAAAGAFCGRWFKPLARPIEIRAAASRRCSFVCLGLFLSLLVCLPWFAGIWTIPSLKVFDSFYRAGALVFGGGHVVLPLLQAATVGHGWLSQETFLAGYGAAQALPGPLFAFSAYLGEIIAPGGVTGALLALIAIYLPAALVLFAALPHWERLRHRNRIPQMLAGANAAVVGLLAAALYSPIWTSTIIDLRRLALALAGFVALQFLHVRPWILVIFCAAVGAAFL